MLGARLGKSTMASLWQQWWSGGGGAAVEALPVLGGAAESTAAAVGTGAPSRSDRI